MKGLRVAVVAACAALASADCPNACSGHGDCDTKDQCICYTGFFGGDCSLRVCPVGTAFVDTPRGDLNHDGRVSYGASVSSYSKVQWSRYMQYESWPTLATTTKPDGSNPVFDGESRDGSDLLMYGSGSSIMGGWNAQLGEAHFAEECSGKGTCDRSLGSCNCYDGYTGAACQRTTCPNDCSRHGICRTVGELAKSAYQTFQESVAGETLYTGISLPFVYRLWDADKNSACICDVGYTGIDCSLRLCPLGDDPLTTGTSSCGGDCRSEIQSFSVDGGPKTDTSDNLYFLTFTDYSGIQYKTSMFELLTDSTDPDWETTKVQNAKAVKDALEALPNQVTGEVKVTCSGGGANSKDQLRVSVEFVTKSGNVPDMVLGWSRSNKRFTYIFQPSQPVKQFKITGQGTKLKFKVYPVDQTLYGDEKYWETQGAVDFSPTSISSVAQAIAEGLNMIPAVKVSYGAPFVADSNVIVTGSINNGVDYDVLVAFPSKQFGANKLTYTLDADPNANFDWTTVTDTQPVFIGCPEDSQSCLSDVLDGNNEAVLCSNRGLCDYSTGLCKCFSGHTGVSCEVQSVLASSA